jgi:hypothetical protein
VAENRLIDDAHAIPLAALVSLSHCGTCSLAAGGGRISEEHGLPLDGEDLVIVQAHYHYT